jgi:Phage integrase family
VTDDAGHVVDEITIRQQKTGEANVVGVSDYTRKVLGRWIIASKKLPEDYLFTRLKGDRRKPLTRDHYRELVKRWARIARADPRAFSTHSLRRTKAAYIYEQTRNIEVIRELLGQKSVSATSAYLNVGKKKALAMRGSLTFDYTRCQERESDRNCGRELHTTTQPNRAVRPAALLFGLATQLPKTSQTRSTPRPHSSAGRVGCGPSATNAGSQSTARTGTGLLQSRSRLTCETGDKAVLTLPQDFHDGGNSAP